MAHKMVKRMISLLLCICLILGAAAMAEHTEEDPNALYFYDTGDKVIQLQDRLRTLGYFEGAPTGGYYAVTASAVEAFQRMAGLPVNGRVASAETLAALYADGAPKSNGEIFTPTPVPTAEPEGLMKFGMRDSDGIRQAQKRLTDLGYFHNSLTGNFFDETKKAVEAFQKAAGLPVNGNVIDEETLNALYSETAPGLNGGEEPVTPTPLPTATPKPEIVIDNEAAAKQNPLSYGDSGTPVWRMQDRLRQLGFFNDEVTGGYYNATRQAVADFQAAIGLAVDGTKADGVMLSVLYSDAAPYKTPQEEKIVALYFGMSGSSAVRRMQDRLKELGYFDDVSTGGYYRMTAAAVEAFQKAAGFPVNANMASVEMQNALYASDAPVSGEVRPTATPAPTAEATAAPEATAVPEATTAPAPAYRTLTYGMNDDDDVRLLQAKLNELGYLSVAPTGGYWSMTASAMRAFLKDYGMSGDGQTATPAMQEALFTKEPVYDVENTNYKTLKYGDYASSDVRAMQTRLRALGYFNESSTGNYYSITQAAVEAFQKAANLPVNGRQATAEMQKLLFSANAPKFGTTLTPEATTEPDTTPAPETQPELSLDYKPLEYGTQGSDAVRAMQNKLRERGFFSVNSTGGYWKETTKAVAAFQEYCGLPVNGRKADSKTLGYLYYTGDLEALLAEQQPDGEEPENGFDADKYSEAVTQILLAKGSTGRQVELMIMRLSELGYLEDKTPTTFDDDVYEAVKWFQNTNSLDSDGVAGPKTLTALYSASALSADDSMKENQLAAPPKVDGEEIEVTIGEVKNVDFFSQAGETYYDRQKGVFKDGATAIITDIETGISFRVRRTGGYYHADVEPASAYDTWQLFQIYNEEWDWGRHAVYVTLSNGETLAGSINGMPHGDNTSTPNNFDGHICLHFLNSRTHGTNNVDPDHQAAIEQAAGK